MARRSCPRRSAAALVSPALPLRTESTECGLAIELAEFDLGPELRRTCRPALLATFFVLKLTGSSINSMVLGGFALALSRLVDNSVVVLENIFRHLEGGESPAVVAEKGGQEVALPVFAGTLTTVMVFFPVTMLYGVSRFLFSALALAVVVSLFASYFVA